LAISTWSSCGWPAKASSVARLALSRWPNIALARPAIRVAPSGHGAGACGRDSAGSGEESLFTHQPAPCYPRAIQGMTWLSPFLPTNPSYPTQGREAHLTDPWLGLGDKLFFRDHHEHGWVGEGRALQLAPMVRLILVSVHLYYRVDKVIVDKPAHLARAEVPRQQVALGRRHPGIRPSGLRRQRRRELEHRCFWAQRSPPKTARLSGQVDESSCATAVALRHYRH
jgi:hypothetical protein